MNLPARSGRARVPSAPCSSHEPQPLSDHDLLLELKARLRGAGLFEPAGGSLLRRFALWLAVLGLAYAELLRAHGPLRGLAALAAGLALAQLALVAHECGHLVAGRRWVNYLVGHLGMTVACGIGFGRWRKVHNTHHRMCQREADDPDMQFSFFLSVHERAAAQKRGLARLLLRFQAYYFWPLSLLYWLPMRLSSLRGLLGPEARAPWDAPLLACHYALWLAAPALLIGPLAALLNYALVSSVLAVVSAAIFAVNHIGMPTLQPGAEMTYLRQQVECTRNLQNHPRWDFFFGGLNFQIEHHLFPGLARDRLRQAQRITRQLCQEHRLAYKEEGFLEALRAVTGHLSRVAGEAS